MDAVHAILRRLRNWFLVWFVAEALVGTAAAAYVLDGMSRDWFLGHLTGGVSAAGIVLPALVVSLMLLLLAWALLRALLDLKAWARVVMLVIGWITVVSAALTLLTFPATWAQFEPMGVLTGADWSALDAVNVPAKVADLAFWSWAIYVLQVNPVVRKAFACRTTPPEPAPSRPAN